MYNDRHLNTFSLENASRHRIGLQTEGRLLFFFQSDKIEIFKMGAQSSVLFFTRFSHSTTKNEEHGNCTYWESDLTNTSANTTTLNFTDTVFKKKRDDDFLRPINPVRSD